jgi:hypothetical protein
MLKSKKTNFTINLTTKKKKNSLKNNHRKITILMTSQLYLRQLE